MWEWLARTSSECSWATLPSRAEKCVAAMCDVSMSVRIGNGASARFWLDNWAPVGILRLYAPAGAICSNLKSRPQEAGSGCSS